MRTKTFVLFLICIVFTSLFLILFGNQRPSIQTIVTETNKHLNNLKTFKDGLYNAQEKNLVADPKYLNLLGFSEANSRIYPNAVWKNTSLPVVLTYVRDGHEQRAIGFAHNVAHYLPNHTCLIYNLGLDQYAYQTLVGHCNSSRCVVVNFDLSVFPSHVDEEGLHAFRPLVIQDALSKTGAVLFLESDYRIITSHIEPLVQLAMVNGFVSWASHYAITALTHPKMFDYFCTSPDGYLFLPMVEPTRLMIYNTIDVHKQLMLPWVKCALTRDCVHPIGAQSGGCRFNKKPQYRYSGCHRFDGSALNIVLGLHFGFDETRYIYSGRTTFFRKLSSDLTIEDAADSEWNTTELSSTNNS